MDATTLLITCTGLGFSLGVSLGYALGRLDWLAGKVLSITAADNSLLVESIKQAPRKRAAVEAAPKAAVKIDINEAKFVAPVDTEGMERLDGNELGKTTVTQDDIQGSVSRLAQLKGN